MTRRNGDINLGTGEDTSYYNAYSYEYNWCCFKCNERIISSYLIGFISCLSIVGGTFTSLYFNDLNWMFLSAFGFIMIFVGAYCFYTGNQVYDKQYLRQMQNKKRRKNVRYFYNATRDSFIKDSSDSSQLSVNMIPQYFSQSEIVNSSAPATLTGRSILRVNGQDFLIVPINGETQSSEINSINLAAENNLIQINEQSNSSNKPRVNNSTLDRLIPANQRRTSFLIEADVQRSSSRNETSFELMNTSERFNHSSSSSSSSTSSSDSCSQSYCGPERNPMQSQLSVLRMLNRMNDESGESSTSNSCQAMNQLIQSNDSVGSSCSDNSSHSFSHDRCDFVEQSIHRADSIQQSSSFPNLVDHNSSFDSNNQESNHDSINNAVNCNEYDDQQPLISDQERSTTVNMNVNIDDNPVANIEMVESNATHRDDILIFNDDNISIDENLINETCETPPPSYEEILRSSEEPRSAIFDTL